MKRADLHFRVTGFLIAILIMACDQWTKAWIIAAAKSMQLPVSILPFFNIVLIFNKGISFGMLAHTEGWVLYLLPVGLSAITLLLVFWLVRADEKPVILALGLIIGGAIGNLIDRMRDGAVTDFLDFHIGVYHWPAFNLADSSVFIGVVIFIFSNIFTKPSPHNAGAGDNVE